VHDFVNAIHVKTDDQGAVLDAVTEVLARAGFDPVVLAAGPDELPPEDPTKSKVRHFLVSPANNGWVSVFDENFVDIFDIVQRISAEMKAPALLLWSQGDRSWGYNLTDDGRKVDQYATDPNYLDGVSEGKPDALSEYGDGTAEQFGKFFEAGKGMARSSMRVFATLFGIRNAESDYEDLAGGDASGVEALEDFVQMTFLKR
jgi:hypothetical protein